MVIRFIHVPKTAGISILKSLKESISSLGEKESESWEIVGADGTYHNKASSPRQLRREDMERKDKVYQKTIDTSFSFSFIRNPWDRFVSAYCYLKEKKDEEYEKIIKPYKTFKDFAINGSIDSLHFLPQTHWIDDELTFIGRFERIESHFNGLCDCLKLPKTKIKNINKTEHKPYAEYYDEESVEAIANKYKYEINAFGYYFDGYS